jgi:hypothetical protein
MWFGWAAKVARNLEVPCFRATGDRLKMIAAGYARNELFGFRTLQGRFPMPRKWAAAIAPREPRAPFWYSNDALVLDN